MSSICGGQRAVLGRDVIGGTIGARGWFPGILFAASDLVSRVQRNGLVPPTLYGKGKMRTESWDAVRSRILRLGVLLAFVGVLRIWVILEAQEGSMGFASTDW